MYCRFVSATRPNYLTIALRCMVVADALMKFLDEKKPLPLAKAGDSNDAFNWAIWLIKGNAWDLRHIDLSYEDR